MVLSINVGETFDKIQHLLMIKNKILKKDIYTVKFTQESYSNLRNNFKLIFYSGGKAKSLPS